MHLLQVDMVETEWMDFPWYRLRLADRRMIILIVLRAQNPLVLLAGTIPLNLETFVGV